MCVLCVCLFVFCLCVCFIVYLFVCLCMCVLSFHKVLSCLVCHCFLTLLSASIIIRLPINLSSSISLDTRHIHTRQCV